MKIGHTWLAVVACALSSLACSSNGATTNPPGTGGGGSDAGVISDTGTPVGNAADADVPDVTIPDAPANPARNPPKSGVLFGAFVGVGANGPQDFLDSEKLIDRRWVIDHRFYSFEDWTVDRTPWAIANHKIPLVTWEPHEKLDDIIAGVHDDMIRTRARGAKALGAEMYLRWGHEMNGNWYPWDGTHNGGAAGGPAKYIAAYRHVHDLFVEEKADNVIWVWCPLVTDVPEAGWNHWTNYYPGDTYVDWVGLDAYNWGTSSSCCVWMSFEDLITPLYKDYAGKKPLMVPETASAEVGGNKAQWILDMQNGLKTKFTSIQALVWFHINKETDWRINSTPKTLEAYKAMGKDPYFNPYP